MMDLRTSFMVQFTSHRKSLFFYKHAYFWHFMKYVGNVTRKKQAFPRSGTKPCHLWPSALPNTPSGTHLYSVWQFYMKICEEREGLNACRHFCVSLFSRFIKKKIRVSHLHILHVHLCFSMFFEICIRVFSFRVQQVNEKKRRCEDERVEVNRDWEGGLIYQPKGS